MFDTINEECAVFGIFSPKNTDVAATTYYALYSLQHRGQESAGIVVNDGGVFSHYKNNGLVHEVFNKERLKSLGMGDIAIGHVRYSTTGSNDFLNAQPIVIRHVKGSMAIAHNGNLINAAALRKKFELKGAIFHTTNDTETIAYAITAERLKRKSIEEAVCYAMDCLEGAYSLVIMSPRKLIAARDPWGFRPLCMGKTKDGSVVFASESCAFDSIGAEFVRDILPGEIVVVTDEGIKSIKKHCGHKSNICVFEYIYFARTDSIIEGTSVQAARLRAGELLWKEHPCDADVVIGVPDSGLDAALGFSRASGIPFAFGFVKNKYVGRSFIQPSQTERTNTVKIKLNVVKDVVKGKRVVMIDDSIVRGTTSARIVNLLKEAGAKEVHVRISCPPFTNPCFFGVDIDSKENLIACKMDVEGIRKFIKADSLGYLSIDSVKKIAFNTDADFCVGCFSGKYPIDVPEEMPKDKFEYKINNSEV